MQKDEIQSMKKISSRYSPNTTPTINCTFSIVEKILNREKILSIVIYYLNVITYSLYEYSHNTVIEDKVNKRNKMINFLSHMDMLMFITFAGIA